MVRIRLPIIGDYKHLAKTLIVTLFSGSFDTSSDILYYLQNYAIEKIMSEFKF